MAISDVNVVDAIAVEITSGKVILAIADHLDWSDEAGHIKVMEEKLRTYLRFVRSGEIISKYPDSVGRSPVVDWVTKFEMPLAGVRFLQSARARLAEDGVELRTRVLPSET